MRDYRQKTTDGILSDGWKMKPCWVTVRMTSDDLGQTLSLQAGDGVQISIPLEGVRDIIRVTEKGDHNDQT